MEVFSRRKLESNWDRYEESEKQEMDDDTPTQRGSDFHVLLESAGEACFANHGYSAPYGLLHCLDVMGPISGCTNMSLSLFFLIFFLPILIKLSQD